MTETVALVEELCAFNSHTFNALGVERAGDVVEGELLGMGFGVERIAVGAGVEISKGGVRVERAVGRAVRGVWNGGAGRRVLVCIHLDTVHLPGSDFVTRREGNRLVGPGVIDAKGGLVVMLEGVRRFIEGDREGRLGVEVLLTPDEEVGSGSSVGLLRESAGRCVAGLVYEPAFPDGAIVAGRKGSGTFTVVVRGRGAHAGRDFAAGRNAAVGAARAAVAIDAINGTLAGVTVNVGVMESGSASNVVPDVGVVRVNVRVERADEIGRLEAAIRLAAEAGAYRDGVTVEVVGGVTSPPRALDERNGWLFEMAREEGAALGMALSWRDSGGTCDGNKLAAYGLPVIDSLGPVGGELHSVREYLEVGSMEGRRAELTARMLRRIAAMGE